MEGTTRWETSKGPAALKGFAQRALLLREDLSGSFLIPLAPRGGLETEHPFRGKPISLFSKALKGGRQSGACSGALSSSEGKGRGSSPHGREGERPREAETQEGIGPAREH